MRLPTVLGYRFEANVKPKLDAIQRRIGLSEAELRKIVLAQPPILGLSFEKNLGPKLDFFQHTLALPPDDVRARIVKMPALLTYSVDARFRPRLERCLAARAPTELVLDRAAYTNERFDASVPVDPLAWQFVGSDST